MWFRKRKQKGTAAKGSERLAAGIANRLLAVQQRVAHFLTEKCRSFSTRQKQWLLAVFCVLFGGLSIQALVKAFHPATALSQSLRPAAISIPPASLETEAEQNQSIITPEDIAKIHRFRSYMDSLSKSETGRPLYDSILKARPHLMDSIQALEQIYSSSSK